MTHVPEPAVASPPTLRDVAEHAGVSTATASNALTGTRPVSAAAREAVLAAAAELGYRANTTARALRTGRTAAIGLVVPDVTNPFFAEAVHEVQQHADERGWSTTLYDTSFDPVREQEAISQVADACDGLVLLSTDPAVSRVGELAARGVPVVACDEPLRVPGVALVCSDNAAGGRAAAHHLHAAGGTRFAVIGGPGRLPTADERTAGFRAGLHELGIELADDHVVAQPYGMDGGRAGMWALLSVDPQVDAIFATTDMQAVGALFGAIQAGRSVPDDVLICGFDGIAWTARMHPTITTVVQDRAAMARTALEILDEMIAGGPAREVVLPVELVARGSSTRTTAPPPA